MTHPALIERITRSLAYMLRHQPDEFGLTLDPQGFGEVEDVVRALGERLAEPVEASDVEEAIRAGDRPRYEIKGTRIRALYGHSIEVEPGEPSKPPEFLFVGIPARDAARAQRFGLSGGRRRFLHLALTQDDAREAGRRAAREYTVLRVFALDAWEEGVDFFDRKSLFLARTIPTEFLEVLESGTDGYEPRRNGREQETREAPAQRRAPAAAPEDEARVVHDAPADRSPQAAHSTSQGDRSVGRRDRDDRGGHRHHGGHRGARDELRGAHGGSHGDRDRRRGRGDRGHGGRPHRDERPTRAPFERPTPMERPAPAAPQPQAPHATSADRGAFGVGIFDEPEKPTPAPPPVRPASPPPQPRPAPPTDEASDFGAGV